MGKHRTRNFHVHVHTWTWTNMYWTSYVSTDYAKTRNDMYIDIVITSFQKSRKHINPQKLCRIFIFKIQSCRLITKSRKFRVITSRRTDLERFCTWVCSQMSSLHLFKICNLETSLSVHCCNFGELEMILSPHRFSKIPR